MEEPIMTAITTVDLKRRIKVPGARWGLGTSFERQLGKCSLDQVLRALIWEIKYDGNGDVIEAETDRELVAILEARYAQLKAQEEREPQEKPAT
jgi:hypothetical protein